MRYFFILCVSLMLSAAAMAQHAIVGKVISEKGGGIPKASVQLLNSNLATFTDEQGNFRIDRVPQGLHTVRVSALGYATENRVVSVQADVSLDIQLISVENRLDEAVVTAQKMESDPHDIAASLSVINSREVEQQYLWNIMDVSGVVPNMNLANPGDNRNVASIRGISTTSYNQAVATYVDGVNQFGLDTYVPYLYDVERIEVLRGPQGTLYGRNAMGGVINIVTRQPTNQASALAEVNVGNYGQQRYLLGVRTPIIKDKLFFGASGMYHGLDGFYTNDVDGSHYDLQRTVFGNYYLKYLINAQWAMALNVKHVSNRNRGAFSLIPGVDDAFENPFHLNQNAKTEMVDETRNLSLSINHFGNRLHFSSQTAYQSNYRYYKVPIDGDFSPLDAISIVNDYGKDWNNVKVFTQEFKLSSAPSASQPLNWTAGTFLFHQHAPTRQGTHFGVNVADMMGPDYADYAGTTSILTNTALNRGVAIFGQLGYQFGDGWDIQAGFRYDYEHAELSGRGEFQPDGGDLMVLQPDTSASAGFHAFSPRVSVKYAFNEAHHIYGVFARGFRAGGISQLSSNPEEAPLRPFDPELSSNFEVGSKNFLLDQRLQLNLTAFYTRLNNAQVPALILPDAITVTENTGRMESLGAELEVAAKVVRNLSLWGSAAFTHAEYTDFNTAGADGANVQLKGNKPVYTPEWTGFLGAQYTIPLQPRSGQLIQLGAYAKFIGQQYFVIDNSIGQDPYGLLNANVSYQVKGYEVSVWGQNLTDKRYIDYAYDVGVAAVHLGRPATFGITLRKKFGN